MSGIRTSKQPWKLFPIFLGESFKIVAMGGLLAVCLFLFFFYEPASPPEEQPESPVYEVSTAVPTLDSRILAEIADSTRPERLVLEEEPFRHVLEASLDVVPSAARHLGMPSEPLDPERLRADPDLHRGRYLWAEGRLTDLSGPIEGHPVEGYDYYEGRLETEAGETVSFAFSIPPEEIAVGQWARMEGFFLKLRDSHFPEVVKAPMLVGRQLMRSYSAWDPVLELDPEVMASVRDGEFREGVYSEGMHSDLTLSEYQSVPLWHLASYAIAHREDMDRDGWRRLPAFVGADQWLAIMRGEVAKGTPMRLLGECVYARTFEAQTNPIGVKAWSEVWVQIHDLAGGRPVPVWIPERVEFQRRLPVEVRGYLLMRHSYNSRNGERRVTPLFVSATLDRYQPPARHPVIAQVGLVLAGMVGLLIVIFFLMARRDRMTRAQHELAMVERRRRRRARVAAATE